MFNVIDFFCGCGGTSAGLRAAGMNIVAGIDYDEKAIKTYQKILIDLITVLSVLDTIRADSNIGL